MLLRSLNEYLDRPRDGRPALLPTLYAETAIRYIIDLDGSGRALTPVPIDTADPGSPRTKRGVRRAAPQVQRASGIKPLLLADKADYTLGLVGPDSKPDRVEASHAAYLELLTRCAGVTDEPAVRSVLAFMERDPLRELELGDDFDHGGLITFRVDGVFPTDLPSVQRFWSDTHDPELAGAPVMQCVVCGQERPVLTRLQAKVKGVPEGQPSGTSIISANAPAFESYGQPASLVAPTCARCAEGFTRAANELLAGVDTRVIVGKAAFIFWTREPVAFFFRSMLVDPDPADVQTMMRSLHDPRFRADADEVAFYAVSLSASGGRTVIRDWLDTTVGAAKASLAQWFERQRIVDAYGQVPRPLGLYALAASTVRDPARELAPPVPRALLRSALTRAPLPMSLLYQVVRRNRAEQNVDRPRAALIKLVLLSQPGQQVEDTMVQLAVDHARPAYHCGRLLAVLEEAQRAALPGVKAGIVDRFYGTASSAPMSVFPRLLRGARPHLARLERDRPGAWRALERRLEEVQSHLDGFPRTLNIEDQGLFALGYYHQRAADRAEAIAAKERGMSPAPVVDITDDRTDEVEKGS
ncbi:MAG: type I-C CRISPR-associated protein Cas8c/Csd1 [Anaerolinea sp.]|jgi:CRISPR-associated protein Csd1|nr:type I-C CRISPR-associated protein Cas8c/Csd1 [Anaerolinea sp.]